MENDLRILHFRTWNVSSSSCSRGLQYLIEVFDKYNINLLTIQEMRGLGKALTKTDHTLYYRREAYFWNQIRDEQKIKTPCN